MSRKNGGPAKGPGHGGPARGYSWEPFGEGNTAAERHGAYSDRRWGPLADELAAEITQVAPWVGRPSFAATVAAWARVEAQVRLVLAYLDDLGPLDDDGKPRPATALLDRLETRAQSLRSDLGLTPQALARLLSSVKTAGHDPDGLDQLRAEGRRILAARQPSALPEAPGDETDGEEPAHG